MKGSWRACSLRVEMALLQETQSLAHFKCSDSVILIVPILYSFIQPIPRHIMASDLAYICTFWDPHTNPVDSTQSVIWGTQNPVLLAYRVFTQPIPVVLALLGNLTMAWLTPQCPCQGS